MIPTVRFVVIFCACAVLIGLSGLYAPLLTVGVLGGSLAIVLALAEWLRVARITVDVERLCEEKLSLGAQNLVRLRVRSDGVVRALIRDEYPEGFDSEESTFAANLRPRTETEFSYHVTPQTRGDYEFGDTYVRLTSALGFVVRQVRLPNRLAVRVYPNLLDIRRYEISLRRELAQQTGRRTARRGRGTEFESLRDYSPDDEFRAVDWKATARRGKFITRQYQEERAQNVFLVLDCGRVMGPVIEGLTRLDHAVNAAMMLAQVAAQRGDRVGLMAFDDDIEVYSPPQAGRHHARALLGLAYGLKGASGDSDLRRAIGYLSRRWTRRSLVVVFTDLIDPESSKPLIAQIAGIARKHLCVCVAMADPAVAEAAHKCAEDPEDAFEAAAARQALQARKLAAAQLVRAGAIVIDAHPEDFTPAVVEAYTKVKATGRL